MAQDDHSLRRHAVALSAAILLCACHVPAPYQAPYQAPSQAPYQAPSAQPPQPPRENRLSPATLSLVTQARTQVARGDLPAASSTLDRALRIEPNNPLLWIELGRLRLAETDAHQAEGCGRKALVLASGDRGAQAQAGRLLADALRAQGRNQEAREVENQPFMISHH
jgi:uncharacterized protein HemY